MKVFKFYLYLLSLYLFCSSLSFAAYDFNGSSQFLYVDAASAVAQSTNVTVCAWINPDTITGTRGIVDRDESTDADRVFQFRINASNLEAICFVNDSTLATVASTGGISTGVWQFVAFTFDGSNINVFINSGTSAGIISLSGNLSADAAGITIGARSRVNSSPSGTDYFDGDIAELAQWSRVLSEAELNGLAGNNSPLFYPTGLQWYAKMIDDTLDLVGSMTFTAYGSPTVTSHPTITYPSGTGAINLIENYFGKLVEGGLVH